MEYFHDNVGPISLVQEWAEASEGGGLLTVVYVASLALLCGVVVGIFFNRGPWVITGIVAYILSLSTMTLTVKHLFMTQQYDYPKFVTGTHFFFSGVVCFGLMWYNHATGQRKLLVPTMEQGIKMIVPIALAFAASVGTNNVALSHANAAFVEMVGGASPLCVMAFALAEGTTFDIKLLWPVLCVIIGVSLCAIGELHFTWLGFGLAFLASALRAYKSYLQQNILEKEDLSGDVLRPIELLAWMSPPCFAVMAIWAGLTEGFAPLAALAGPNGMDISIALVVTIVNACILNVANNFVIRDLGAVGCLLAGQLKGMLLLMGAAVLLGEVIQLQQIFGWVAIVGGVYFYNKTEKDLKSQLKNADLEKAPLVR